MWMKRCTAQTTPDFSDEWTGFFNNGHREMNSFWKMLSKQRNVIFFKFNSIN